MTSSSSVERVLDEVWHLLRERVGEARRVQVTFAFTPDGGRKDDVRFQYTLSVGLDDLHVDVSVDSVVGELFD